MPMDDSGTTVLRLEGREALALLDRISTRRLIDLAAGEARWAPFCDFRGRLLHRALVAVTADRAVWLLRDDAPSLGLAASVNAHIFREDISIGIGDGRWAARLLLDEVSGARPEVIEQDGALVSVHAGDELRMVLTE